MLAICVVPYYADADPSSRAASERLEAAVVAQELAFERGVPTARVVRLAHAKHCVFISNEADVLREMRAFIRGLPQ